MKKWFLDLKMRSKLFLGFGLVLTCLGLIMTIAILGISTIQASQKNLVLKNFANVQDLLTMDAAQNADRTSLFTMLGSTGQVDRDNRQNFMEERSLQVNEAAQRVIKRNPKNERLMDKMNEYKNIRDAFMQTRYTEIIPMINVGAIEQARSIALGIQEERYDKMHAISSDLISAATESMRVDVDDSQFLSIQLKNTILVIGIVIFLISMLITLLLNRVIAMPIHNLTNAAERMAAGDLSVGITPDSRADEVGTLTRAFSHMAKDLRNQTSELIEGTGVLGAAASEIVASSAQLASSASESAVAVSETTTTVEEVRQTAQVASEKAKQVSDSAHNSVQIAQSGRKSTEDVTVGMGRIREQMDVIAASMARLSEQSQTIGQIIASVEDLATQSNLLAVNAAIEAAKAGEHGKGFGVVAQEVKSLAAQSRQATNQVRGILSEIQQATKSAVMATEQGSKAVEAGTKQTEVASESIQALVNSVNSAVGAARQIAASSQQQLVGVDQVAGAMESIKQASAQNVTGAKQLETSARNLNELGQRLKRLTDRYKV